MKERVAILGAGSWGLTLAQICHDNGHSVAVWEFNQKQAEELTRTRKFTYLPEVVLSEDIYISSNLEEILEKVQCAIIAIPSAYLREIAKKISQIELAADFMLLSVVKGFEDVTFKTMSQVIMEELPKVTRLAVLSGPNIAREIASRKPAATVISSRRKEVAEKFQKLLMTDYFRIYTADDVVGSEIGGAAKNVIAIACGICDGLELGTNAKAALITRGLTEIVRLGKLFKARAETFSGLSGMGDLITTCYSQFSRNRRCGELIAQGKTYEEAMKTICTVIEGIGTCKALHNFSQKNKLSMPINEQVYNVLFERKPPHLAVKDLMKREAKPELTEN